MIKLYTSHGCASCRKSKKWLDEHNVKYEEKNIFNTILKSDEIKEILAKSENGTDDIISTKSKIIKELGVDINEMSINELISFIQQNPSVLRRPIIIDDNKFQVGYDEEEIRTFIPRELRRISALNCNPSCKHYRTCGSLREEND